MKVKELTLTAILLSLVLVLAPVSVPLGIVPLSLQTFIIPLVACFLPRRNGVLLILAYLLLGGFGLPVFANWSSGWAVFSGPTGGYLLGMFIFPLLVGLRKNETLNWQMTFVKVIAAATIQLFIGALWLGNVLGLPIEQALMIGVVPFIIAMVIKTVMVVVMVHVIKSRLTLNAFKSAFFDL